VADHPVPLAPVLLARAAEPVRRGLRSGRLSGPLRSAVLLTVVYAAFAAHSPLFYSTTNTSSLLAYAVPGALIAIGQTFVIATGEIDLGVANVAALAGIVFVRLEPHGLSEAFAGALGVGVAAGALNGCLAGIVRIPSLVTSLAVSFMAQGFSLTLASKPVSGTRLDLTTGLDRVLTGVLTPRILFGLVVFALAATVLGATVWGRSVYARGANAGAARLLGLPDRSVVVAVFLGSGVLSATAGIVLAISLNSGSPVVGGDLLLLGIAACLIGGSRLEGGTGSVAGSVVALLALLALENGMDQIGVSSYAQQVVRGAVVLAALLAARPSAAGGVPLDPSRLRRLLRGPERP
jgi:ribose/xylose/arabinose/galactoside ABC-type transport system permease subunit